MRQREPTVVFLFLFSFETRRPRGDRSFRPEPLRITPLEDIEFLDDIQIKGTKPRRQRQRKRRLKR